MREAEFHVDGSVRGDQPQVFGRVEYPGYWRIRGADDERIRDEGLWKNSVSKSALRIGEATARVESRAMGIASGSTLTSA